MDSAVSVQSAHDQDNVERAGNHEACQKYQSYESYQSNNARPITNSGAIISNLPRKHRNGLVPLYWKCEYVEIVGKCSYIWTRCQWPSIGSL